MHEARLPFEEERNQRDQCQGPGGRVGRGKENKEAQSRGVALYSVVRDKELVKWWRQQIRNETEKSKKEPK